MRVSKLLEYGLSNTTDIETRRHVVFSNLVYIVVGSILLCFVVISSTQQPVFSSGGWIPVGLIVMAGIAYLLNTAGLHLISRIFFIVNWFLWVSIVPVIFIGPPPAAYYSGIAYVVVFSPAIQLFFSMSREAPYLIVFMLASFLLTFFYFDFLLVFDRNPGAVVPLTKSVIAMKINYLTLWAFLNVLMMYILRINRAFYSEIRLQKEIIETQQMQLRENNEELAIRNTELTAANHELIYLNEQVRTMNQELEARVGDRTRELVQRNEKLTEYAFMNAHLLRSPVSRIKGLINLFIITKEAKEKEQVQALLSETAEELDNVIHAISDRLNKT